MVEIDPAHFSFSHRFQYGTENQSQIDDAMTQLISGSVYKKEVSKLFSFHNVNTMYMMVMKQWHAAVCKAHHYSV